MEKKSRMVQPQTDGEESRLKWNSRGTQQKTIQFVISSGKTFF